MADSRDDFIIAIRYALLKKGAKQKFSLFFLILFSIFIIFLDKSSFQAMISTRSVLNDFVYRVAVTAALPGKFIKYSIKSINQHLVTNKENVNLKKEIEFLKNKKFKLVFLQTENKFLKKTLRLDKKNSERIESLVQNTVINARVILDQKSPYLKSILLDKGKKNGILKGMTVFSGKYLIGTIIESNYFSSRVLLITDLNSKIPVIIEDSYVNGILVGKGSKKELDLEYMPDEFKLEPNLTIYTSGKDGILEIGIPVATTYIDKKGKVAIQLIADPDQASIVSVTNGQIER